MTWRGFHRRGHATHTRSLIAGVLNPSLGASFGVYKRRHETMDAVQKLGAAARRSAGNRKMPITLPDRPFDWRDHD